MAARSPWTFQSSRSFPLPAHSPLWSPLHCLLAPDRLSLLHCSNHPPLPGFHCYWRRTSWFIYTLQSTKSLNFFPAPESQGYSPWTLPPSACGSPKIVLWTVFFVLNFRKGSAYPLRTYLRLCSKWGREVRIASWRCSGVATGPICFVFIWAPSWKLGPTCRGKTPHRLVSTDSAQRRSSKTTCPSNETASFWFQPWGPPEWLRGVSQST